jgi:hypothetical protein
MWGYHQRRYGYGYAPWGGFMFLLLIGLILWAGFPWWLFFIIPCVFWSKGTRAMRDYDYDIDEGGKRKNEWRDPGEKPKRDPERRYMRTDDGEYIEIV